MSDELSKEYTSTSVPQTENYSQGIVNEIKPRDFKCGNCKTEFNNPIYLTQAHSQEKNVYACPFCGFGTNDFKSDKNE